jgi:hypothetical protein
MGRDKRTMNRRQFGKIVAIATAAAAVPVAAERARATPHPLIREVRLVFENDQLPETRPGELARANLENFIETTLHDGRRLIFRYAYSLDRDNIYDLRIEYALTRSHAIRKALVMIGEILDGNRAALPDGTPPEPWTGAWAESEPEPPPSFT